MKIKEFDEKVRIGSEVVFEGKICHVRDLNRKTHEASLGRSELWVRCSEFEPYYGGEVPPYVADKEPPVRMGRPPKPVIAIFADGRRVFLPDNERSCQGAEGRTKNHPNGTRRETENSPRHPFPEVIRKEGL